jgi:hypothetical protein
MQAVERVEVFLLAWLWMLELDRLVVELLKVEEEDSGEVVVVVGDAEIR